MCGAVGGTRSIAECDATLSRFQPPRGSAWPSASCGYRNADGLILYGYQVGSLVVPTLAPILLWLWMDKKFVAEVVMRGWRGPAAPAALP